MVINISTTSIEFYPFIDFEGVGEVTVQVWHKRTKKLVSTTSAVIRTNSSITVDLPILTDIADVAENLDLVLIRIFSSNALFWEYLATWSDSSTDINNNFKVWTTTTPDQPQWVTI